MEVGSADDDESDFECYDKSGGKPVYVQVDKDITGGTGKDLKVALPPGLPEKKETSNNNGTTRVWDESRFGNTSYRRSNKKIETIGATYHNFELVITCDYTSRINSKKAVGN